MIILKKYGENRLKDFFILYFIFSLYKVIVWFNSKYFVYFMIMVIVNNNNLLI